MRDKKLSHMTRKDLVEIIYQLQQSEDNLKKEIEDLKAQLEDRRIRISEAGSVAEAALSLNHVFEAAQAACEMYVNELRSRSLEAGNENETPVNVPAARSSDIEPGPETRNDEQ